MNNISQINEIAAKYIEHIKEICKEIKPLVVIRCITYNHADYLREALEGFLIQKTDFPYVAIVHEDASTDGTADVLREYAEKYPYIILPIFEKENQYSKRDGSLRKILNTASEATGAKYIAMCDGDDYWTDPLKLQKQVYFLEDNPEYVLCYTKVKLYTQSMKAITGEFGELRRNTEELILLGNSIPTVSVIIKYEAYLNYLKDVIPEDKKWLMGDYPIWLYCISKYKIKFLNFFSGTYRILEESASHSTTSKKWLDFQFSIQNIQIFFLNKFEINLYSKVETLTANAILRKRILYSPDLQSDFNQYLASCNHLNKFIIKLYSFCNNNYLPKKILKLLYLIKDNLK